MLQAAVTIIAYGIMDDAKRQQYAEEEKRKRRELLNKPSVKLFINNYTDMVNNMAELSEISLKIKSLKTDCEAKKQAIGNFLRSDRYELKFDKKRGILWFNHRNDNFKKIFFGKYPMFRLLYNECYESQFYADISGKTLKA